MLIIVPCKDFSEQKRDHDAEERYGSLSNGLMKVVRLISDRPDGGRTNWNAEALLTTLSNAIVDLKVSSAKGALLATNTMEVAEQQMILERNLTDQLKSTRDAITALMGTVAKLPQAEELKLTRQELEALKRSIVDVQELGEQVGRGKAIHEAFHGTMTLLRGIAGFTNSPAAQTDINDLHRALTNAFPVVEAPSAPTNIRLK